jgi:hypothetical protein
MLSGRPAVGPPNGIFPLCSLEQQEAFTPSLGSALQSHRWPTEDAARHVRGRAARPRGGESTVRPIDPLCVCLLAAGAQQAGAAGTSAGDPVGRASRPGTSATPQSWWQRWHSPD